jgi:DNA repair exonuclease SbcCD ATPase subunit
MEKLIKQGSSNYQKQKNGGQDLENYYQEEDQKSGNQKNIWQRKKMIKEIREEIEKLNEEIKSITRDVQTFKPNQAEAHLTMLNNNLEVYREKIVKLNQHLIEDNEILQINSNLRKEELQLAKKNNSLIELRDELKKEIELLDRYWGCNGEECARHGGEKARDQPDGGREGEAAARAGGAEEEGQHRGTRHHEQAREAAADQR